METWHDRLERALKARGKTYGDLVRVTRLAKPSVYAWQPHATKRTEMMDGGNAAMVCDALQISPMWLFHNRGDRPDFLDQGGLGVQSPVAEYRITNPWPFHPADECAYDALSDEARGWVKCRLAMAIEEATTKFSAEGSQRAAA